MKRFSPTDNPHRLQGDIADGAKRVLRSDLSDATKHRILMPTDETVKSSPGIPAHVLAARKAARKALVRLGRTARKQSPR